MTFTVSKGEEAPDGPEWEPSNEWWDVNDEYEQVAVFRYREDAEDWAHEMNERELMYGEETF